MRITVLLLMLFLAACASRPSMEELEDQAMASGDWSAVEAREKPMNGNAASLLRFALIATQWFVAKVARAKVWLCAAPAVVARRTSM